MLIIFFIFLKEIKFLGNRVIPALAKGIASYNPFYSQIAALDRAESGHSSKTIL